MSPLAKCAVRSAVRGFTLIELLVTVSILAVLIAITGPSMTGFVSDARLSSQSDLLVDSLNLARMEAVKQRINITFCPAANADTATACSTNTSDWSKGWIVYSGTNVLHRIQAKTNVSVTNTQATVVFTGTLGSAALARTFTLCTSGRTQQQIDVALSGHVSKKINTGTTCP